MKRLPAAMLIVATMSVTAGLSSACTTSRPHPGPADPAATGSAAELFPSASEQSAGPTGPCPPGQLTIGATLGPSAGPGQQSVTLTLTNTGSATCRLLGYPTVIALRTATPVGDPARQLGGPGPGALLAPGATATATLLVGSGCPGGQRPDSIQITPPGASGASGASGATQATTVALDLPGCTMIVSGLAPG